MTPDAHSARDADNGIGGLLRRLRSDAVELLRAELALARAEFVTATNKLLRGALLGMIAAVLLLGGLLALLAAAIIVMSFWLPMWLAACALGILLLLAGVLTFHAARSHLDAESLALPRTRHSLQQDLDLAHRREHEQDHQHIRHDADPVGARAPHGAASLPH